MTYPGKHFEIREHDAPTKYVWNGETRVARVTGSLSQNLRVQHLRLFPGWNLCSTAVGGARLLSSLEIAAAYQWNATAHGWDVLPAGATLPAGTVLWLKATASATFSITGLYSDPTSRTIHPPGDFLPSAGFEIWNIKSASSNIPSASAWSYDSSLERWLFQLPSQLPSPDFPAFISPGTAVFIQSEETAQLHSPDPALRLGFFHGDHLGSSVSGTDSKARSSKTIDFYPFGDVRSDTPRENKADYKYVQNEQDAETQASYFEYRYLIANLGRFSAVDPWHDRSGQMNCPQSRHPYGYGKNNPLKFIDPDGLTIQVVGERKFMEQVGKALMKIDPSARVDFKTGKVYLLANTSTKGHETGHKLLERMIKSAHVVSVVLSTSTDDQANTFSPSDLAAGQKIGEKPVQSGGKARFNPEFIRHSAAWVNGKIVQRARPAFIALTHELIHGDHAQRGNWLGLAPKSEYLGLDKRSYTHYPEEARTVGLGTKVLADDVTENQIRQEAGEPLRPYYD